jgi:hypothetical protein
VTEGCILYLVQVYRRFMMIDESADWVPTACTLPTAERPLRIAEFEALFAIARWSRRTEATQLDLAIPAEAERAARALAEREATCCSFFTFSFQQGDADVVMHIDVPAGQIAVLDALQQRVAAVIGEAQR